MGGTFNVVGGDVHNHPHTTASGSGSEAAVWALLQAVPNFRRIYQDMLAKATAGTGVWLLKGDKFRIWLEPNGDIKIFWGSGIPGAGKTVLASIVIEMLEALRTDSNLCICVCYIYFRYSDHAELTLKRVLETLIKQTLERHPDCLPIVADAYAQHLREGTEPTETQLLGLLRQLVDGMAVTFYVLDALDEAPPSTQLTILNTLASLNVKLFITSRPLEAVEANFPDAHSFRIAAQDSDIELHITKGINEAPHLLNLIRQEGPSLREEIMSTMKRSCGGMFLHASLQMDALRECVSVHQIRHILDGFPSQMEAVYHRTWQRILEQSPDSVALAKAVMLWVLNASRSMTLRELERAVATSPETHSFHPTRLVPGTTLLSLCRGLVMMEEESEVVRLVHYTAKEPLNRLLNVSFPHPHSLLADVCITRLEESGFQDTDINSAEAFTATLQNDPLLAYASEAWHFHARESMDFDESKRRTLRFVLNIRAFPAFTGLHRTSWFDLLTPLHVMALYHLPPYFAEGLVIRYPNIRTRIIQQSPLIMASWSGHERLVTLLLKLPGVQVNGIDADGFSALMRAAYVGHTEIVALILRRPKVRINLVHKNGWSALMLAASEGHGGIVTLLLAQPTIKVNLISNNGRSALMLATSKGHGSIVALLLAQPTIQVNLVGNNGWSALMLAASKGHGDIVALLLAQPTILVNLVDNDGWSALIVAVKYGHENIPALLLTHPEIQVNLVDEDGRSALLLAALEGYPVIVTALLAHPETQVNLVDARRHSALMLAAETGYGGIAKLLLSCPEIQVNLVDKDGYSALMLAARNDHEEVATPILAHPQTQVNLVNERGVSALMLASFFGYSGIVRILLSNDQISINLISYEGNTALLLAAAEGHKGVVRMLLDVPGIDTTVQDQNGYTAKSAALASGHIAIFRLLKKFESRNRPSFLGIARFRRLALESFFKSLLPGRG